MSVIDVFVCESCGSRREVARGREVPVCGTLHVDVDKNDFPSGHWVRITTEHFESHGEMTLTDSLDGDPLRDLREAGERSAAERRERAAESFAADRRRSDLMLGRAVDKPGMVGPDGRRVHPPTAGVPDAGR